MYLILPVNWSIHISIGNIVAHVSTAITPWSLSWSLLLLSRLEMSQSERWKPCPLPGYFLRVISIPFSVNQLIWCILFELKHMHFFKTFLVSVKMHMKRVTQLSWIWVLIAWIKKWSQVGAQIKSICGLRPVGFTPTFFFLLRNEGEVFWWACCYNNSRAQGVIWNHNILFISILFILLYTSHS